MVKWTDAVVAKGLTRLWRVVGGLMRLYDCGFTMGMKLRHGYE